MNKLPDALPCDTCKTPTSLDMAGEVRMPTALEIDRGYEIVVTCIECVRKYDLDGGDE